VLTQAVDYREECEALHALLSAAPEDFWTQPTQFKAWTPNDVLGHLHFFDRAALATLEGSGAFARFVEPSRLARLAGRLPGFTAEWLEGCAGQALLRRWRESAQELAERYAALAPETRLEWGAAEMSARSCITGRQMETWAHGQALFDQLGQARQEHDRIRNIAVLGVNTFGWTFKNRGLPTPAEKPFVRLTAPSGGTWTWNDPEAGSRIEGSAAEFCQVVAQTRNVADTALKVSGEAANAWMAIAQCFAGGPEDPPPPGARHVRR
jgi:uncharacterized protein (TIGR03084 family)